MLSKIIWLLSLNFFAVSCCSAHGILLWTFFRLLYSSWCRCRCWFIACCLDRCLLCHSWWWQLSWLNIYFVYVVIVRIGCSYTSIFHLIKMTLPFTVLIMKMTLNNLLLPLTVVFDIYRIPYLKFVVMFWILNMLFWRIEKLCPNICNWYIA